MLNRLAAACVLLLAAHAHADTRDARQYFTEGRAALAGGRDIEAADAFEQAADRTPAAAIYFNLADTLQRLGRLQKAARALEKCLKLDDQLPDNERREIEATITALQTAEPSAMSISALRSTSRYRTLPAPAPQQTIVGGVLLGLVLIIVTGGL
jgi:tetratricopeptide (TPR) repeat protein